MNEATIKEATRCVYDRYEWVTHDFEQVNHITGEVLHSVKGVEFPTSWSGNAETIVVTKYFRGDETSLKHLVDRIVVKYTTEGFKHGYFDSEKRALEFAEDLANLIVSQKFAFNSPVWFNVGVPGVPQTPSACFLLSVHDSLESILNWYREEGLIFKGGSGAGVNLSNIRSSYETLSGTNNTASGPVSFMRGADASAGTIKSGGRCIAPWSEVYTTERGPVRVDELAASGEDFTTISYNPMLGRTQAVRARAWKSGEKELFKLTTDKGVFTLSGDHPVLLMTGEYRHVSKLTPGNSIRPMCVSEDGRGYFRVGLHDGKKGKISIHRLVAQDILEADIPGKHVHHMDMNPANNAPENLEVVDGRVHVSCHNIKAVEDGTHPLLQFHGKGNHPKIAGDRNGMSHASGNRTEEFLRNRDAGMRREDVYRKGQKAAVRQRMLNKAYEVANSGGDIDTFDGYIRGRMRLKGWKTFPNARAVQLRKIEERFGSYEAFRDEARANNHRVVSVEPVGQSVVYDVEVDSDTPYDKSVNDGHNFFLVSETQDTEKSVSGIVVSNSRRAAKLVCLDVSHPDIEEFIGLKAREERKIKALSAAGFDMSLNGKDMASVQYQNANNSVQIDDAFMRTVVDDGEYALRAVTTGEPVKTVRARDLFRQIAQAAWECADPGVQFSDTINAWHTLPEAGRIETSNPCFTGDTLVATADGRNAVRIDQLAAEGKPVDVYSTEEDGTLVIRRMTNIRKTRDNASVYKVTLDDGSSFTATGDHEVICRDGSRKAVLDLVPGQSLMPFDSKAVAMGNSKRRAVRGGKGWQRQYWMISGRKLGDYSIDGMHVHHRNHDALDDSPDNLVLMNAREHNAAHMRGEANPVHGITDEWRANLSEACSGERNGNFKHGKWVGKCAQIEHECPVCGESFTSFARQVCCSIACRDELRRRNPQFREFVCESCGGRFDSTCTTAKYCSDECRSFGRYLSSKIEKVCEQCGSSFQTTTSRVKFCSKQCGAEHRWDSVGRVRDTAKLCGNCGEEFVPRRKESKYCNSSCAARARVEAQYAAPFSHNHKVVSVEPAGKAPVFDGEVAGTHNFAVITSVRDGDAKTGVLSGFVSGNCGEYLSISDSSCNLGSFNLVKFMDEEGSFEIDAFLSAVDVAVRAMDISVTFGDFPTEKISENTKKYRQLGLGVANLGAMLMRMGLPYDSDEGRMIAAEITSAMTAQAYITSAALAERVGPYFEYEDVHKEAHTRVLEKHRVAHSLLWDRCYALGMDCTNMDDVANMWERAADAAEDHGLRNAQVTLAAPTGTISFMMDCDTTGIEPDFALVKHKTLVGGSSMSIINESVPHALRRLGYENVDELAEYVMEHGTVVGAPGVRERDLAVFDCAIGERAISAEGHLKMMEALQPFLSGAISKTVNLPESVTVEEIEQVYLDAWHKGLKSVTVYRDNCKVGQPLESKKSKEEPKEQPAPATPKRRRLPKQRQALTTSFRVGGAEGYLTTGSHEDGQLGEMFLKLGKQGSTMAGLMDAFSVAVSIALQYGVPLETYVAKFTGTTFEPSGMTDDPDVRMATSIIDYVFRRVAIDHMDFDTRAAYGVLTAAERRSYVETGSYTPDEEKPASVEPRAISKPVESLPLCVTCGAQMRPAGTCYACEGCGATSGCS